MTLAERIRYIREDLGLSRAAFGDTLGISGDVVNNLERNRVNISESILRLICKTHRVNYFWLTEENGDPYVGVPEIVIDEAIEEYGLDDQDKKIIEEYVKLDPAIRQAFKNYLKSIFNNAPD